MCSTPSTVTDPIGSAGGVSRSVSPPASDRPQIGDRLHPVARVRSSRSVEAFGVVRSCGSTPPAPSSTTSRPPITPTMSRSAPAGIGEAHPVERERWALVERPSRPSSIHARNRSAAARSDRRRLARAGRRRGRCCARRVPRGHRPRTRTRRRRAVRSHRRGRRCTCRAAKGSKRGTPTGWHGERVACDDDAHDGHDDRVRTVLCDLDGVVWLAEAGDPRFPGGGRTNAGSRVAGALRHQQLGRGRRRAGTGAARHRDPGRR